MDKSDILRSITQRTNGDIYLGVVGAVRTGKSTFIKKVIENLVVPNIQDEYERKRCLDEIPQSAQGKTIMTTEPKFVPSNSATINIDNFTANIRLVDCVGYVIPSAKGYEDDSGPRMVKTPWYDEQIPFIEAAEVGTEKVIKDHSTIGIVVTTDGSIGEIAREDYIDAETRVINELKEYGKPFIVILNSVHPMLPDTERIAQNLKSSYDVPVLPINIENMGERDIYSILKEALYEFPISEVRVSMPDWIGCLTPSNWLKKIYIDKIKESVTSVNKLKDVDTINGHFTDCEYISKSYLSEVNSSTGEVTINLEAPEDLYSRVLNEIVPININSKMQVLKLFQDYNETRLEFEQFKSALKMVKQTGYGVASPTLLDMKLDKPEIVKQGNRYGIKLKAVAPAIHIRTIKMEWNTLIDVLMQKVESLLSLNII